jgi:PAS domain-containing protein
VEPWGRAHALSKNIVDTVPIEYQEEAREFIKALKRGELVATLETKRKTKDGKIVDVWLTNTKLTDDKGMLTGIATTERDISERMGSLEKFRRMATVIQDSNDAITFQDLEGNILAWNRGAELMYGYSEDAQHEHRRYRAQRISRRGARLSRISKARRTRTESRHKKKT